MIIECNVLSYNPHSNILAFVYQNKNIQITIDKKLNKDIKTVSVKFENGSYYIVNEKEKFKNNLKKIKKINDAVEKTDNEIVL